MVQVGQESIFYLLRVFNLLSFCPNWFYKHCYIEIRICLSTFSLLGKFVLFFNTEKFITKVDVYYVQNRYALEESIEESIFKLVSFVLLTAKKEEKKKPEPESESDDDMGFGLFD